MIVEYSSADGWTSSFSDLLTAHGGIKFPAKTSIDHSMMVIFLSNFFFITLVRSKLQTLVRAMGDITIELMCMATISQDRRGPEKCTHGLSLGQWGHFDLMSSVVHFSGSRDSGLSQLKVGVKYPFIQELPPLPVRLS